VHFTQCLAGVLSAMCTSALSHAVSKEMSCVVTTDFWWQTTA